VKPYRAFKGDSFDDPRTTNSAVVAYGLFQIIESEGPMIAKRAYDTYLRAAGVRRMGRELKKLMNRALDIAIRQKRVLAVDELNKGGFIQATVRAPGSPEVVVRTMGPRTIDEVPFSEIRAIADRVLEGDPGLPRGSEEHMRAVLEAWGVKRLTSNIRKILASALR